jgi:hypothetical protein
MKAGAKIDGRRKPNKLRNFNKHTCKAIECSVMINMNRAFCSAHYLLLPDLLIEKLDENFSTAHYHGNKNGFSKYYFTWLK